MGLDSAINAVARIVAPVAFGKWLFGDGGGGARQGGGGGGGGGERRGGVFPRRGRHRRARGDARGRQEVHGHGRARVARG